MNNPLSHDTGIDPHPFEDGRELRNELFQGLTSLGARRRYRHLDFTTEISSGEVFNVVHVDGDHNGEAVA